ncbi:MAG: MFS transporter, partial [candidate division WOR-3 bacterium]|nr:MFS transporter [candidate division WOR-3 bacterium]
NYSATFGVSYLLSLYLQHIKKLTASQTGIILITQPIMMAILSPLAGKISDKIEARITASIGMTIVFVSLVILVFLKISTALSSIVLNLLLIGAGLAIFSSPNMNAIMSSVTKEHFGIASGTLATMRLLGQMFSMAIVMSVTTVIMGNIKITPENYLLFLKSNRITFLIYALLCFSGIFASLARGKITPPIR